MSQFSLSNISIKGISACVPEGIERTADIPFYSPEEAKAVEEATGVIQKHVVKEGTTASDLSICAAEKLISELGWEPSSIDILCFVTQTPDYSNHPNCFVAHEKLGLSENCIVLDLFHGCPGWVMGLSTIVSLMSNCQFKRGLLLVGDTVSAITYKLSRESRPLFGDAGTATALEFNSDAPLMYFDMGTDSKNGVSLIHKRGRAREPHNEDSFRDEFRLIHGEMSADEIDDNMDGMSVFAFGISKPPKSIKKLMEFVGVDSESVDKVVLHQANKMMVSKIIKKIKVAPEKSPLGLTYYGNTTQSSIPLAIVTECGDEYRTKKLKTICCGFGTGLSWASVYFETDKISCPPIMIYKDEKSI